MGELEGNEDPVSGSSCPYWWLRTLLFPSRSVVTVFENILMMFTPHPELCGQTSLDPIYSQLSFLQGPPHSQAPGCHFNAASCLPASSLWERSVPSAASISGMMIL